MEERSFKRREKPGMTSFAQLWWVQPDASQDFCESLIFTANEIDFLFVGENTARTDDKKMRQAS